MGVIIKESGMRFGEYNENDVFPIETSKQYTKNLLPNGVKVCEFILKRGKKLYFIEAKSSCPRQILGNIPDDQRKEKQKTYDKYIDEIVLKMRHSLSLYGTILMKRHSQDNVPEDFLNTDLSETLIYLVLVINPQGGEWEPEPELQDDLRRHLKYEMKLWNIQSLVVITANQAKEKHFIIDDDVL